MPIMVLKLIESRRFSVYRFSYKYLYIFIDIILYFRQNINLNKIKVSILLVCLHCSESLLKLIGNER